MTRQTRQRFFWALVCVFIIGSPLVVLSARGYRFDLARKKFVPTGAFFMKSDPSGAAILVNGVQRGKTSGAMEDVISKPGLINTVLPGEYDVRLEKQDYRPWAKRLAIRARQVTEARNIVLFPDTNVPRTLYFNRAADAAATPDGETALVISHSAATAWAVFVRAGDESQTVAYMEPLPARTGASPAAAASALRIRGFSPSSRFAFVEQTRRLPGATSTTILALDRDRPNTPPLRRTIPGSASPRYLAFPDETRTVWQDARKRVFALDPAASSVPVLVTASAWGVTVREGRAFALVGSPAVLFAFGLDGKAREQIATVPVLTSPTSVTLVAERLADGRLVLLVTPEGAADGRVLLVQHDGSVEELHAAARGIAPSPDGKRLLVRTQHELWVHYAQDVLTQPVHYAGERVLASRFGTTLRDARWHAASSDYLLYVIPEGLFALELDDRGPVRNNADLVRNGDITLLANTRTFLLLSVQDIVSRFLWTPEKPRVIAPATPSESATPLPSASPVK